MTATTRHLLTRHLLTLAGVLVFALLAMASAAS